MKLQVGTKTAGELIGDTLLKRGKQVVLFRIYDGFAVSNSHLNMPELKRIRIEYEGSVYKATKDQFLKHGIPHKFGNEQQLVLPRRYFDNTNQERLF